MANFCNVFIESIRDNALCPRPTRVQHQQNSHASVTLPCSITSRLSSPRSRTRPRFARRKKSCIRRKGDHRLPERSPCFTVPRNRLNLPVPFPFFRAVQPRNGGHLFALLARAWRRTVVSIPRRVVSPSRQSLGRVRYTSFGALSLYGDLRWHSLQPSFIRRTRTSAKLNSIIRVLLYGSIRDPVKYSILFYKCFRDLFSRFFLLC